MKKKILIPGGKIDDCFLVEAAKKMGLYVITSGFDEDAPAHIISDEYIKGDYSDKEEMLRIAKENHIDYMCSCANDYGMMSTAYVCEQLGLPGHDSCETTMILHNKDRFKKLAEKIGLSTPKAVCFSDVKSAMEFLRDIFSKMIIKPIDGCAGMGITEVEKYEDCEKAVKWAFECSKSGKIVIEPFIEGKLHSASCFLVDRKVVFCFIEEGIVKPTNHHAMMSAISPAIDKEEIKDQIVCEVEKVAEALSLVDGKIHMNFVVDGSGKVYIIEMHRRCSGDTYSKFIMHSTGVAWNEWIVKAELGMDVHDFPANAEQRKYTMYFVVVPEKNGALKEIQYNDSFRDHIIDSYAVAENGRVIDDCRKDCLGIFHLEFSSYEETRKIAENPDVVCKAIIE